MTDFQELVEEAITRTALNPPVTLDLEKGADDVIELFNTGGQALEHGYKHRLGPFARFGLR